MKIGSYPNPLVPALASAIVPFETPLAMNGSFPGAMNPMQHSNLARLSLMPLIRLRMPSQPTVLKTYEEYTPGNPLRDSTNRPEPSIMSGFPDGPKSHWRPGRKGNAQD